MNKLKFEELKDLNLFFYHFLTEHTDVPKFLFDEPSKLVDEAFIKQDVKFLQWGVKDMLQTVEDMPVNLKMKLKAELLERFNFDIDIFSQRELRKIEKIIEKNVIKKDQEYALILNRVEEIYQDKNKLDEVKRLNQLLSDYIEKNA